MKMPRHPSAFSLVQLMIVLVIVSVLIVIAAPSFQSQLDGHRVRAAASGLYVDIQYARSEAVRRNAPVTISFSGTRWCYGVDDRGACACDPPPSSCNLKTVDGNDFERVSMAVAGACAVTIDPRQGQMSGAACGGSTDIPAITFASTRTPRAQVRLELNAFGRIRQCSPGETLPGYPRCCGTLPGDPEC